MDGHSLDKDKIYNQVMFNVKSFNDLYIRPQSIRYSFLKENVLMNAQW